LQPRVLLPLLQLVLLDLRSALRLDMDDSLLRLVRLGINGNVDVQNPVESPPGVWETGLSVRVGDGGRSEREDGGLNLILVEGGLSSLLGGSSGTEEVGDGAFAVSSLGLGASDEELELGAGGEEVPESRLGVGLEPLKLRKAKGVVR
jgi:hypothetical protein